MKKVGIALEYAGKIVESRASVASIHLSQSLSYSDQRTTSHRTTNYPLSRREMARFSPAGIPRSRQGAGPSPQYTG